jgi:hypothetical protein
MRWDALFEDLESQLRSASTSRQESEIRDRTRSEQSRVTLVQRLQGQRGGRIGVVTGGGRQLSGTLTTVGAQWIALESEGRFSVVPLSSMQLFRGLGRRIGQPLAGVQARLGFGSALRGLSRDRAHAVVWLLAPSSRLFGVIDRVGADFLELGVVASGEERRPQTTREVLSVPFTSIDSIDAALPPV